MGGGIWEQLTPATVTVTTGTTTLTAAQLLKKLIPVNCTDTGTLALPTADLIMAGCPGLSVGMMLEFQFINFGDSTVTIAVGTGITNKVIDSVDAVLTVATHEALRMALVVTAVASPSAPSLSNTFDLYGYGVTAAATS